MAGAFFFCVGLFTVCTFGLNLFTGKVCYLFDHSPSYLGFLLLVWVGNLIGAALVGYGVRTTRIASIADKAAELCQTKLNDNLWSIFLLAVFCNVLIFLAVDGFQNNPHELGKYLGLVFGVTVFILCGFEHCVANMFYFCGQCLERQDVALPCGYDTGKFLRRVDPSPVPEVEGAYRKGGCLSGLFKRRQGSPPVCSGSLCFLHYFTRSTTVCANSRAAVMAS